MDGGGHLHEGNTNKHTRVKVNVTENGVVLKEGGERRNEELGPEGGANSIEQILKSD